MTPQSGNRVSTSLGNSGLQWTIFARNRDTAVPAEGNGDLQTLICVLVARSRRYLTLSNPVPWQNWMAAYLGYTLRMKTLFHGWPVMVNDTHTRRRRRRSVLSTTLTQSCPSSVSPPQIWSLAVFGFCSTTCTEVYRKTFFNVTVPRQLCSLHLLQHFLPSTLDMLSLIKQRTVTSSTLQMGEHSGKNN